jgi:hypothetical protein
MDPNNPNTCLAATDEATCLATTYNYAPCTFTNNKCVTLGPITSHFIKAFNDAAAGAAEIDASNPYVQHMKFRIPDGKFDANDDGKIDFNEFVPLVAYMHHVGKTNTCSPKFSLLQSQSQIQYVES